MGKLGSGFSDEALAEWYSYFTEGEGRTVDASASEALPDWMDVPGTACPSASRSQTCGLSLRPSGRCALPRSPFSHLGCCAGQSAGRRRARTRAALPSVPASEARQGPD